MGLLAPHTTDQTGAVFPNGPRSVNINYFVCIMAWPGRPADQHFSGDTTLGRHESKRLRAAGLAGATRGSGRSRHRGGDRYLRTRAARGQGRPRVGVADRIGLGQLPCTHGPSYDRNYDRRHFPCAGFLRADQARHRRVRRDLSACFPRSTRYSGPVSPPRVRSR